MSCPAVKRPSLNRSATLNPNHQPTRNLRPIAILLSSLFILYWLFPHTAKGQIIQWSNATGSPDPFFHVDNNWNGGIAPDDTQRARFQTNRAYEVWWNNVTAGNLNTVGYLDVINGQVIFRNQDNRAQHKLTINGVGGDGTFSDFRVTGSDTVLGVFGIHLESQGGGEILGGATLSINGSAAAGSTLSVLGNAGMDIDGELNVTGGGQATLNRAFLGRQVGDAGTIHVNGNGSHLEIQNRLDAGLDGTGNIQVTGGATVSSGEVRIGASPGSTGNSMTVSGNNSTWTADSTVRIGYTGEGNLDLNQRAHLQINSGLDIGSQGQSVGVVRIDDSSANIAASLDVGATGTGTLEITGDSQVSAIDLWAGISTGVFQGERYYGTATILIDGPTAELDIAGRTLLGSFGQGSLEILNGATHRSGYGQLALNAFDQTVSSNTTVTIDGANSKWILTPSTGVSDGGLTIGSNGDALVTISGGGRLESDHAVIAEKTLSESMVNVTGADSVWINQGDLEIGGTSTGGLGGVGQLQIGPSGRVENGGTTRLFENSSVTINGGTLSTHTFDNSQQGSLALVDGTLQVTGAGGVFDPGRTDFTVNGGIKGTSARLQLENSARAALPGGLVVGDDNVGFLDLKTGGSLTTGILEVARQADSNGSVLINGGGSRLTSDGLILGGSSTATGGTGSLEIENQGVAVINGTTKLWSSGSLAIRSGELHTETFDNSSGGNWNLNDGLLRINGGSLIPGTGNDLTLDGKTASDLPTVHLANGANLDLPDVLTVGRQNRASFIADGGSQVSTKGIVVGSQAGSQGTVSLSGLGTHWDNLEALSLGSEGQATMAINDRALFTGQSIFVAPNLDASVQSQLTIDGDGTRVELSDVVAVGNPGNGRLEITGGGFLSSPGGGGLALLGGHGVATVHGDGSEWQSGNLFIGGSGRGEVRIEAGGRIVSGNTQISLPNIDNAGSGLIQVTGNNSRWINQGSLYVGGNSSQPGILGEVEILDGGHASIKGLATNWETGSILIDNGSLDVGDRLINDGQIFGGRHGASLYGTIINQNDGVILTEESGVTNFYGDVTHQGKTIQTDELGTSRFFGAVDGSGDFAGQGLVRFESEFRPGSSPAEVFFEGDVAFGNGAELMIEIGGLMEGEFDQLDILGDLSLAGELSVSLIDNFELAAGQEFLIADVGGTVSGQFAGLGEGAKVADFGMFDLHVSYQTSGRNGVRLFTAVPEPGSAVMLAVGSALILLRRRRSIAFKRAV